VGFARLQRETWSPPGWFDEDEFAATARSFANPEGVAITLNAYRSRFLQGRRATRATSPSPAAWRRSSSLRLRR